MATLGTRIKNLRKIKRLTQKQIEYKTGISSGNLSGYESGRIAPSSQALVSLAQVFGCSIDYLLTGNEYEQNYVLSDEEMNLLYAYRRLSEDDQDEVRAIVNMKSQKKRKRSYK